MTQNNKYKFVTELSRLIVESANIPKVQVERIVGPIMTIYIERLLKILLNENVKLLSPEFPLKKSNNQSTNIDWLLINKEKRILYLVELKTDVSSDNNSQLQQYKKIQQDISEKTAAFLISDLEKIQANSGSKKSKYDFVRYNKIGEYAKLFDQIKSSEIIYIVPSAHREKLLLDRLNKVFTLSDIYEMTNNKIDQEWKIIAKALFDIDKKDRLSRSRLASIDKYTTYDEVAKEIKRNHASPNNYEPSLLWIGNTGGKAIKKPNYQIQYTNGSIIPYRFSGKEFKGVEYFKKKNMTEPFEWKKIVS